MDLHDYLNIRRVLRTMAAEWNCPVWVVKATIRRMINNCWDKAMSEPKEKALWETYFPKGKLSPEQYILLLGHAHERGEDVPFPLHPQE